jgi:ABC-type transport system involved in cytochrome c biogenesis permease subunit
VIEFHQIAAALYLGAGLAALLGIALPEPRLGRIAAWGLVGGVVVHALGFATLHTVEPTPPLTDLALVISLIGWMAVVFLLIMRWLVQLPGFIAALGPVAFLATFGGALRLSRMSQTTDPAGGSLPHAHVLLAAAGLALLGVSGVAGLFYLFEHNRLKAKRAVPTRFRLPSLEALDRVNTVALAVGLPMLTLGVLTGVLWQHSSHGSAMLGTSHETWTLVAWVIYTVLALARFVGNQGARYAAASAVAGFAFLLFAVVGVGVLG